MCTPFVYRSLRVAGEGGVAKMNAGTAREGGKRRKRKRGQPLFLRFVRGAPFAGSHYRSMDGWVRTGQRAPTPPSVDPSCSLPLFLRFYASSMTPPLLRFFPSYIGVSCSFARDSRERERERFN